MIAQNLVKFLTHRGWTLQYTTCMFHSLVPPANLLSDNFILHVPQNFTGIDFTESLNDIVQLIAAVYDMNIETLRLQLEQERELVSA